MYVLGLNGPPQCGKDTLASLVERRIMSENPKALVVTTHLSLPLREIAYRMIGLTYPSADLDYESFKRKHFQPYGRTGRELMIDVSEQFLKPCYGSGIMAGMLLDRLKLVMPSNAVVLVPDSGFQCEMDPLINGVGMLNCAIARVSRVGCDFSNDSREWVYHPTNDQNIACSNDGDLDDLMGEAARIVAAMRNWYRWQF